MELALPYGELAKCPRWRQHPLKRLPRSAAPGGYRNVLAISAMIVIASAIRPGDLRPQNRTGDDDAKECANAELHAPIVGERPGSHLGSVNVVSDYRVEGLAAGRRF